MDTLIQVMFALRTSVYSITHTHAHTRTHTDTNTHPIVIIDL